MNLLLRQIRWRLVYDYCVSLLVIWNQGGYRSIYYPWEEVKVWGRLDEGVGKGLSAFLLTADTAS